MNHCHSVLPQKPCILLPSPSFYKDVPLFCPHLYFRRNSGKKEYEVWLETINHLNSHPILTVTNNDASKGSTKEVKILLQTVDMS